MKSITRNILDKEYFIFDLDGTLVNSMTMWNEVDACVLADVYGINMERSELKEFRDSILFDEKNLGGDIYTIYFEELIRSLNLGVSLQEFKAQRHKYADYLSVKMVDYKPGVEDFLTKIKSLGKKIVIVTTSDMKHVDIYSDKSEKMQGKTSFKKLADLIVTRQDVTYKKPNPEGYLVALSKLKANPEDCIVFEDSLNGVIAAKEAGLEVMNVVEETAEREQHLIDNMVDYKIETFSDLNRILGLDAILVAENEF